ncbi:hypothetical protein ASC89_08060 [Devosia sp. Root413D1]|uniref:hypothetical protein n=1 Tax=Devosia sp. Root413D1 TaxID=1736531 RepID=UPI0007014172|nr:hypothetical protein [Devosia sp. Root413D1]KQW80054.1 hypothetical protein ASC89_08060 [Devosia sp. Root413D1]
MKQRGARLASRLVLSVLALATMLGPVDAVTVVACLRDASEITFRGEHVETVAAGVFDSRKNRIVASSDGDEVFIVAKVRVLELGDVPPDVQPPAIGEVVGVLQRLVCTRCDASRTAQRGGYSQVGEVLWFKASIGQLGGNAEYKDQFAAALLRTAVSYQFALSSWCDASTKRNWKLWQPR